MAEWVPADQVDPLSDRYRELYSELGIEGTFALPGAAEALDAVRDAGGQILVVTAKYEPNAWKCLEQTGLVADIVVGRRHGPQKGETLAEYRAAAYVGDTPPDVDAAHLADAIALGGAERAVHRRRAARRGSRRGARNAPGVSRLARGVTRDGPRTARLTARTGVPPAAGAGDCARRPTMSTTAAAMTSTMPATTSRSRPNAFWLELSFITTAVPGCTR